MGPRTGAVRRARAAGVTLAALALAGAGCTGGGRTGSPAPTTTAGPGPVPTTAPATPTTGPATPTPAGALVVAADGSGRYRSVQAAVDAVPSGNTRPVTISIKKGTYRGTVRVPADKGRLTLVGATGNAADVVLVDSRSAKSAGGNEQSSTVVVASSDVTVADLTISNAYNEASSGSSQAVALTAKGDRQVYRNVRVLGDQDTLLTWTSSAGRRVRQYFTRSYIEGDVDFIFGSGTTVFEDCEIRSSNRGSTSNNGYVTAASTYADNPYGFLFVRSRFTSDAPAGSVYLGRPWHPGGDRNVKSQVLIRESNLGAHIRANGPWTDMSGFSWKTDARFSEYANTGPGAAVNGTRPQLSAADAARHTPERYLAGSDGWNPRR